VYAFPPTLGTPRLRIYSETLPYEEVAAPRTVHLLARYGLEIVLAVRPWQLAMLPRTVQTLRDADVSVSVWPMIADEDGRWASAHNADRVVAFARSTVDALEAARLPPRDVLLDLEPPFSQARALTKSMRRASAASCASASEASARGTRGTRESARETREALRTAPRARIAQAEKALGALVADLAARGIEASCAVWPLVALDPPDDRGWQTLLGTPVDALGAAHVSAMVYTSMLEGWSRGTLRRRDVAALLDAATARVVSRWKERGGVSLGCVGTGAFEDEPVYRDPSELAEDTAVVRAAGCEHLALFDLGGVLARSPAESWLDAFTEASDARPFAQPKTTKRVFAARKLVRAATWALRRRGT